MLADEVRYRDVGELYLHDHTHPYINSGPHTMGPRDRRVQKSGFLACPKYMASVIPLTSAVRTRSLKLTLRALVWVLSHVDVDTRKSVRLPSAAESRVGAVVISDASFVTLGTSFGVLVKDRNMVCGAAKRSTQSHTLSEDYGTKASSGITTIFILQ